MAAIAHKNSPPVLTQRRVHIIALLAVVIFLSSLLLTIEYSSWSFWLEYWWMFPIALTIAITVNTLGVSGAALFVPFFILLFPFLAAPLTAVQSVQLGLITESFGLSSSALAFFAFGLVDKKLAFISAVGALPFVIGGALLTVFIPKAILLSMIAVLLIVSVALIHYKKRLDQSRIEELSQQKIDTKEVADEPVEMFSQDGKQYKYCRTKVGYKKRFLGYGLGGFFQGAAGFGIGELGIISMIMSRIPIRISIGTSHFIVAATAIIASIIHVSVSTTAGGSEAIPWNLLFMTVPAVVIGGQLAPFVAAKLSTKSLEKFISVLFVGIAVALLLLVAKEF